MKKLLSMFVMATTMVSLFGATYYTPSALMPTGAYNWNSSIWATTSGGTTPADLPNGPLNGDSLNMTGLSAVNRSLSILETGGKIGGSLITADNRTRTIASLDYSLSTGSNTLSLYASDGSASYGDFNIALNIDTFRMNRGNFTFTNSSSTSDTVTKMNVKLGAVTMYNEQAGALNFGTSNLAIDSVEIGSISFTQGNNNQIKSIKFTNVSGDVKITDSVTTNNFQCNVLFTSVGGNIILTAKEDSYKFRTIAMDTIKTKETKIEFAGLDDFVQGFAEGEEIIMMSWSNTLSGATALELLGAIETSKYGDFRLFDDSVMQGANSIIFTRNSVIPEPAEIAGLLGLIALGFTAYKRKRMIGK